MSQPIEWKTVSFGDRFSLPFLISAGKFSDPRPWEATDRRQPRLGDFFVHNKGTHVVRAKHNHHGQGHDRVIVKPFNIDEPEYIAYASNAWLDAYDNA